MLFDRNKSRQPSSRKPVASWSKRSTRRATEADVSGSPVATNRVPVGRSDRQMALTDWGNGPRSAVAASAKLRRSIITAIVSVAAFAATGPAADGVVLRSSHEDAAWARPFLAHAETATAEVHIQNLPAQAAGVVYGDSAEAAPYANPGGLVVAGRDNYQDQAFKDVSAAGGTVLLYLDAVIDNPYGRYHDLLINASECGPATSRWPGNYQANSWGYLNDFKVGSVLQGKLECVLEKMVAENPHMGGWFADDLGSRAWFPDIDWDSFPDQAAYRAGAIALTQTFRKVADRHQLIFLVNGTWSGGALASAGGGYPNAAKSGNALADGGVVEHHDGEIAYFGPYGCSQQWALESPVTQGKAINYAITSTYAGTMEYVNSSCYSYVNHQTDYGISPRWGTSHWTGLPTSAR